MLWVCYRHWALITSVGLSICLSACLSVGLADNAFEHVDGLDAILQDSAMLSAILTYHVHVGRLSSGDLTDRLHVHTLEGSDITVRIKHGDVQLRNGDGIKAVVQDADIEW